jgi:small-conductance mechanosensitive channel
MRLPASLRAGLYAAGGLVAASGVVWLFVRNSSRGLATACMEIHGTMAMVLLVLIGAAMALHAPAAWRERKNRFSGTLFAGGLAALILTGALLYYAGDERLRAAASTVHWTIGLAAIAFAVLHISLGRGSGG